MQGPTSFGRWLKQRRKALELTQDDLARLVNCSEITIRKIEANERRPSKQIAELLADQLSIAPSERTAFLQFARGEADDSALTEQLAGQHREPVHWRTSQRPTNLVRPLTQLIARAQEIAALRHILLHGETRLLTVAGPGGIGKTSLALEVAYKLIDEFTDGVFLVTLDTITDPQMIAPTIAQTLGLVDVDQQPLRARLIGHLRDKHLLLVLDNFEHIVGAAPLVTELLAACPWLHIIVTSRAPLHVRGERQFLVQPLPLPEPQQSVTLEAAQQYGAVALFTARAQAARSGWELTEQNASAVVALCQQLDGLPLAIELTAAHSRLLAPHEMLAQIRAKSPMLAAGFRDLPTRQQTLRNAIDWSYNLLEQETQKVFARLSVFNGGCTLQAALAICGDVRPADTPTNLLDQLSILVDQSLLRREESQDGSSRFAMLNTIRDYAREKLEIAREATEMQDRHLQHFLEIAESAEPLLRTAQQREWVARLEQEHNNFQAALEWCRAQPCQPRFGLRLAGALGEFWYMRSYPSVGRSWLELFLERDSGTPTAERAKALHYAGMMAGMQGDSAQAIAWYQESVQIYRGLGNTWGECYALADLGYVQVWHDYQAEQGRMLLEESLALSRQTGDPWLIARVTLRAGMYSYYFGRDLERARALLEESLAQARIAGDTWNTSNVLIPLSNALWSEDEDRRTIALAEEALALARAVGNQASIARALNILGMIALADGNDEQARSYHTQSLDLAQSSGLSFQVASARYLLGLVAMHQREYLEAQAFFTQCINDYHKLNDKLRIALCMVALAGVAEALGQTRRAVRLLGATAMLLDLIDARLEGTDRLEYDQYLAETRARLDPALWHAEWSEGQTMTLDQALIYAVQYTSKAKHQATQPTTPI